MKFRFLGTWSSNIIRSQRNISFIVDDKIVFDFGPHALESLLDLRIDPASIPVLAITHMHLDHYSGVAELLWYRAIHKAKDPLIILGPKGIKKNTEELLKVTKTPEQFDINVKYVEDRKFDNIEPFRGHHLVIDNGYRFEKGGKTLFYSGDTAYSENIVKGAEGVDYLFHEMTYTDEKEKEAAFWRHSTYSSTMRVFKESKAKHIVPVHLTTDSSNLVLELSGKVKGLIHPSKMPTSI